MDRFEMESPKKKKKKEKEKTMTEVVFYLKLLFSSFKSSQSHLKGYLEESLSASQVQMVELSQTMQLI